MDFAQAAGADQVDELFQPGLIELGPRVVPGQKTSECGVCLLNGLDRCVNGLTDLESRASMSAACPSGPGLG